MNQYFGAAGIAFSNSTLSVEDAIVMPPYYPDKAVEFVAQTILRIDYTNLGVTEQGDAAPPEA